MKQSNCSADIIQASVDEVMSYWEELYKRFLSLKKIHEQTAEQKVFLSTSFVNCLKSYFDVLIYGAL